ncbi:NADAR family protein [Neptuniibacter sp. QD37_11]|uniref:NADAR family protein n=1 Tax=Neptuniibacter sp. QD37_11 TaxID=3398209 RepID=UPI0039F5E4C7
MFVKRTETHFYFWLKDCPLSNWFSAEFEWKGHEFSNSEQAMMWAKAKLFKDENMAAEILTITDPKKAKWKGRDVTPFSDDVWHIWREKIMRSILLAKFTQHSACRTFLLDKQGLTLVEASESDVIWGVGLRPDDPRVLDEHNWRGLNLLGKNLNRTLSYILSHPDLVFTGQKINPEQTLNH